MPFKEQLIPLVFVLQAHGDAVPEEASQHDCEDEDEDPDADHPALRGGVAGGSMGDILQASEIGLVKIEPGQVSHFLCKGLSLVAGNERQGIPVDLVVDDLGVEPHGEVGHHDVFGELGAATGRDVNPLATASQVNLGAATVSAADTHGGGPGKVRHKLRLLQLVNSLFGGDHFKPADGLGRVELLHVQRPQAGVVETAGHYPKLIAQVDLTKAIATHEVDRAELDIEPGVSGGDGQDVVPDVGDQLVVIVEWKREGVEPEEAEQVLG